MLQDSQTQNSQTWKHVAVGAFAIMSGVGALGVAASGSGALLTVLGYTSGTASGVFGSMELFEGMQNVTISLNGMKYTDAVNPLKSTMGEDAYNMGLVISTATADVVTGIGAVKHWLQKHHGSTQIAEAVEKTPKGGNVGGAVEKLKNSESVYDGVKNASEYLKQQGGRYLCETFTPLTNRNNLVLPYEWNSMTGIQQYRVRSGTKIITGNVAAQTNKGIQYVGGSVQWYINNLEDLILCQ